MYMRLYLGIRNGAGGKLLPYMVSMVCVFPTGMYLFILLYLFLSLLYLQCPDPPCKQDLLAYLEQIKFYSHQLKICSQVKAEIQNLGGELIMSAVSTLPVTCTITHRRCHHYLSDEFSIGHACSQLV